MHKKSPLIFFTFLKKPEPYFFVFYLNALRYIDSRGSSGLFILIILFNLCQSLCFFQQHYLSGICFELQKK